MYQQSQIIPIWNKYICFSVALPSSCMQRHGDRDLRRRPDPDGPADERSGGGVVGTPNWGWRGHFFGWLRVRARRVWAGANNEWIGSPWEPHNIIMMNWIGSPWEQLATGSDRHGSTPGGGARITKQILPPQAAQDPQLLEPQVLQSL